MFDVEAIRAIIMAYPILGDKGDTAAIAALFAADGVLESSGRRAVGPVAICAWLSDPAAGRRRPPFVRHHVTSCLIEPDGAHVRARSYLIVLTDLGVDHAGSYSDRFIVQDGLWRIAERRVFIDWVHPDSTYRDRLWPTIPDRFKRIAP